MSYFNGRTWGSFTNYSFKGRSSVYRAFLRQWNSTWLWEEDVESFALGLKRSKEEKCSTEMEPVCEYPLTLPQGTLLLLHWDNTNDQMVASHLLDPPDTPLVTAFPSFLPVQWNSPRVSDLDLTTFFFCVSRPLLFPPPFLKGLGRLTSLLFKTTLPPLLGTHLSVAVLTLSHLTFGKHV